MTVVQGFLCGALVIGAVVTGYLEVSPFLGRSEASASFDASQAWPAYGPSSFSKGYALNDCLTALESPLARLEPAEERTRIADNCLARGLDILASNPADGLAHIVAARASATLGDGRQAAQHIVLSASVSPHEMWLAQLRTQTAWEWTLEAFADVEGGHRRDIAVVAMRKDGRRWLAGWYVSLPQSRPAITSGVATLPADDQAAFVKAVQAASVARAR